MHYKMAHRLYQRLLALYPPAFREQFGESMAQNFHDLYREQAALPANRRWLFVFWLFGETAFGILQERLQQIRQGENMKTATADLRLATVISLVLTLPFVLLELIHQPAPKGTPFQFPYPLFVVLWLAPLLFHITLLPMLRSLRTGNSLLANPAQLVLRLALLIFLALMWVNLLRDQLPCFLGVPNCD
jgi:hypothetical protein